MTAQIIERRAFVTSDGKEFADRFAAEEWQGELDVVAALAAFTSPEDARGFADLLISAPHDKLKTLIAALEPYT